jgi:hypothetical protein
VLVDSVHPASNPLEVIWDRTWALYKLLSPVPLLDTWQQAILMRTGGDVVTLMRETAYPPLGRIGAARISLPESFPEIVSGMVKAGELTLANRALENLALAA